MKWEPAYPKYDPKVNAVLDAARAARQLEGMGYPVDILEALENAGMNWWWSFVEIILDYEDAEKRSAAH